VLTSLKPLVLASALASLLATAAGAQAEITVYTTQAAFLGATGTPGVDSFDDLALDIYDEALNRTAGGYTYQVSAAGGLFGAGTGSDHWLSSNLRLSPIVFQDFSSGVNAFGGNFFGSDIGGQYLPNANLILTAADGSSLTYTLTGATQASFVGFVSDVALTSVSLSTDGGLYWPTANDVVLAVPEPATYGMLLAGLGCVGAIARRRGRRT